MSAVDTLYAITQTELLYENLKFCLVNEKKLPFTIKNTMAAVNNLADFVDFDNLLTCENLDTYAGLGISIQASNVCAIDIDKCVSKPFDENSINLFAKEIIDIFKNIAYIEFSFSGTGIRILFRKRILSNYSEMYYIKNSKFQLEYYQPNQSSRYVTVTGKYLYNNSLDINFSNQILINFLNKYMKRPVIKKEKVDVNSEIDFDTLMKKIKYHYHKYYDFQNLWFTSAPGSGKDESERDYRLVTYIYTNITQSKELIKRIFEESEFFKTKDKKHIYKWTNNNYRYFNYLYKRISEEH